jgi:hypothetical protein
MAAVSGPASDATDALATLHSLCEALRRASLDVVWRQWGALGGMTAVSQRATSLVDPEALVLFSLRLVPSEPRLAGVVGDWVALNSDVLSVQRMRNLSGDYPPEVRAGLADLARVALQEGKDHRWKSMLAGRSDGSAPEFVRRGAKRRAVRVEVGEPAALVLRLRLAFGVGIKADVLALLLGRADDEWTEVSAVARSTGYTVAAVRKAIDDLAEAQFIERGSDARAEYRASRASWRKLLGGAEARPWCGWHERFVFGAAFFDWASEVKGRPLTAYVLQSQGRTLIERHHAAFRYQHGWLQSDDASQEKDHQLSSAIHSLAVWMQQHV